MKYCPHYSVATAEGSKIKQGIGYQKIRQFPKLVNMCKIYDEDSRARVAHYKNLSEKRGNQRHRGTPYSAPANKGKQRVIDGKKPRRGGISPNPIKYFKCGGAGHRANEFQTDVKKCFKCERPSHVVADYRVNIPTCYNYGEQGHISTNCQKPNKPQAGGKVFALAGSQPTSAYRLIKSTCYIYDTHLIAIIDTGATHSFIYVECVKKLGLVPSTLGREMVIDTPFIRLITTSLVFLNCPLSIFCKEFGVDLICLLLSDLDIILGMN